VTIKLKKKLLSIKNEFIKNKKLKKKYLKIPLLKKHNPISP
jgi:hypothetical protein